MSRERKVAVLGAGTMGAGIAELCALRGFSVALFDVSAEVRARALTDLRARLDKRITNSLSASDASTVIGRIELCERAEDAVRERAFVIEAVPEDMELKARVLSAVLPQVHPQARSPAIRRVFPSPSWAAESERANAWWACTFSTRRRSCR